MFFIESAGVIFVTSLSTLFFPIDVSTVFATGGVDDWGQNKRRLATASTTQAAAAIPTHDFILTTFAFLGRGLASVIILFRPGDTLFLLSSSHSFPAFSIKLLIESASSAVLLVSK